jgi:cysteine desulfurase
MKKHIYFDNAATTFIDEAVLDEMNPFLTDYFGNPSSIYEYSNIPVKAISLARERVSQGIGASVGEIYFTSGGSESNNWAIVGSALKNSHKGKHIITSKIEHHAVLHTFEYLEKRHGFSVSYIDVDSDGFLNLDQFKNSLKNETILVSIMMANNEIGTIQPIKEISKIVKDFNKSILVHTDAVQAFGNIPVDVNDLGIDLLTITAHKIYGPKGVGALYIKKGVVIDNLIHGGGQEKGKRAGTENVIGIVGFGKASEIATDNLEVKSKTIADLRDYLFSRVIGEIPEIIINGSRENRLPGNVNFSIKRIEGEALILSLDHFGISCSSGSACTSGSLDPSHVLLALGLDHGTAHGSLRISLGKNNTREEVDFFVDRLKEITEKLRLISPL